MPIVSVTENYTVFEELPDDRFLSTEILWCWSDTNQPFSSMSRTTSGGQTIQSIRIAKECGIDLGRVVDNRYSAFHECDPKTFRSDDDVGG